MGIIKCNRCFACVRGCLHAGVDTNSVSHALEGPGLASRVKCRVRVISVGKSLYFLWFYSYLLLSPLGYTLCSVFIQKLSLWSNRSFHVVSRMELVQIFGHGR